MHRRARSGQVATPEKRETPRPKSMFARLSPNYDQTPNKTPAIPSRSPKRTIKRFSFLHRNNTTPDSVPPLEPLSPLRTPVRSGSLRRTGSLQTRRYNYTPQDDEAIPQSPRRSLYANPGSSHTSLSVAPLKARPLFERQGSQLSSGMNSPAIGAPQSPLMQSPNLETQTSVWIQDRKQAEKRSSFLGRSSSVRSVRSARESARTGLGSPMISSPQFVDTTHMREHVHKSPMMKQPPVLPPLNTSPSSPVGHSGPHSPINAQSPARLAIQSPVPHTPVPERKRSVRKAEVEKRGGSALRGPEIYPVKQTPSKAETPKADKRQSKLHQQQPKKQPQETPSPSKRFSLLKRIFKKSGKQEAVPTPTPSPSGLQRSASSAGAKQSSDDRQRKFRSAGAISKPVPLAAPISAPSRPHRQPGLDLFRNDSEVSLESSTDSNNSAVHSADLVTPTAAKNSPSVYIEEEWGFPPSMYNRRSYVGEKSLQRMGHHDVNRDAQWI